MKIVKNMSARLVDGIVPGAIHEFPETEDEVKDHHKRRPGDFGQPGNVVMWDDVKASSSFKAGLLAEGDHPMPLARVIDITGLPVEKALILIASETDTEMLHAWHDDPRSEVKTACAERAKAVLESQQ